MKKQRHRKSNSPIGQQDRSQSPHPVSARSASLPRSPLTIANLFQIDPRSLAVFRMAIGAVLLFDLFIRVGDLTAMYTDDGMFSRSEICYRYTSVWNWSFHFANGSPPFQGLLFGLAALSALALMMGYETRLASIASWLFLVSIQNRVIPILDAGDTLLRMLLFWGMFLPMNRMWSIDAWKIKSKSMESSPFPIQPVASIASVAILLQMAFMYFFSALFKSNVEWLQGGVIAGSLAHDAFARPMAHVFLNFPLLLKLLTLAVFLLEWIGPFALFCPKRHWRFRLFAIAALMSMHLGILICLNVGLFSYVSITGLLLFLPDGFWNGLRWKTEQHSQQAHSLGLEHSKIITKFGSPHRWKSWSHAICGFALICVVAINLNGLRNQPFAVLKPFEWGFFKTACGFNQKWNMFEDAPSMDGWYVALATLNDGSRVDLLREGRAVSWERPHYPAAMFPNHRWQKVFREMTYEDIYGYHVFRKPIAEYLCRKWNANHDSSQHVKQFEFVFCMIREGESLGDSKMEVTLRKPLLHLDHLTKL